MSFTTISVIGLGYIGLPTAAAFASRQKHVIGVDINQQAVDTINRGAIHIVEPDLDSVVKTAVEGGFLRATTTPVAADAYLIAVPTPFKGHPRIHLAGGRDRTNGRMAGGNAPGSDFPAAGGGTG